MAGTFSEAARTWLQNKAFDRQKRPTETQLVSPKVSDLLAKQRLTKLKSQIRMPELQEAIAPLPKKKSFLSRLARTFRAVEGIQQPPEKTQAELKSGFPQEIQAEKNRVAYEFIVRQPEKVKTFLAEQRDILQEKNPKWRNNIAGDLSPVGILRTFEQDPDLAIQALAYDHIRNQQKSGFSTALKEKGMDLYLAGLFGLRGATDILMLDPKGEGTTSKKLRQNIEDILQERREEEKAMSAYQRRSKNRSKLGLDFAELATTFGVATQIKNKSIQKTINEMSQRVIADPEDVFAQVALANAKAAQQKLAGGAISAFSEELGPSAISSALFNIREEMATGNPELSRFIKNMGLDAVGELGIYTLLKGGRAAWRAAPEQLRKAFDGVSEFLQDQADDLAAAEGRIGDISARGAARLAGGEFGDEQFRGFLPKWYAEVLAGNRELGIDSGDIVRRVSKEGLSPVLQDIGEEIPEELLGLAKKAREFDSSKSFAKAMDIDFDVEDFWKKAQEKPGEKISAKTEPLQEERLSSAQPRKERIASEALKQPEAEITLPSQKDLTIKAPKGLTKKIIRSKAFTKTQESIQDSFIRVKQLMETKGVKFTDESNPYLKEALFHGRVAHRLEDLRDTVLNIEKDVLRLSKKAGKSADEFRAEVDEFLVVRHAPERNAALEDGAAGITTKDAKKRFAELKALPDAVNIEKIADDLQTLNKTALDVLKDGQVISDEVYDTLRQKYKNHVPLQRIFEESEDVTNILSGARGFSVKGSGLKKAVGSQRKIADITTNILANAEQAIIRAEKNRVNIASLKLLEENKELFKDVFSIERPKAIGKGFDEEKFVFKNTQDPLALHVRVDGKPVFIKFSDPDLAKAFQGVNVEHVPQFFRAIAVMTRFYSGLATRFNPEFAFSNITRDVQDLLINSTAELGGKAGRKAALKVPKSAKDVTDYIFGKDTPGTRLYKQMIDDGGTTGGLGLSTRKQIEVDVEDIRKIARKDSSKAVKYVVDRVDNFNQIFEDATRLGAYKQALESGLSREQAAFLSKNATVNFNKKGTAGPVINSLWMFANAGIQGSARTLKSMADPKVATAVVGSVGALSYFTNYYNDTIDPDWRDKIPPWDKNHSIVFVYGKDVNNELQWVKIPVAWGIKPIKVLFDGMYELNTQPSASLGETAARVTGSFFNAYNPIGGEDFYSAVTPTILDTVLDVARNKKWSGSIIYPDWKEGLSGPEKIFKDPETLKEKAALAASEFLFRTRLAPNISPEVIEYIYDQHVGGTGRAITRFLQTIGALSKGEASKLETRETFIKNRFFGEADKEQWEKSLAYRKFDKISKKLRFERDVHKRKQIMVDHIKGLSMDDRKRDLYKLREAGFDTRGVSPKGDFTPKYKRENPEIFAPKKKRSKKRDQFLKLSPEGRQALIRKMQKKGFSKEEIRQRLQ